MTYKRSGAIEFKEKDLKNWRTIRKFQKCLHEIVQANPTLPGTTWLDPKRKLLLSDYLSLLLFSLLNPVIDSLRGASSLSNLGRVQDECCTRPASLGSLSEAQHLVDPQILEMVFADLLTQLPENHSFKKRFGDKPFSIVDSSVWQVYNRLHWAHWRSRIGGNAKRGDCAIRLHLTFDLTNGVPHQAVLTKAKECERKQWQSLAEPGHIYIADRYYGYSYKLLDELIGKDVDFIVRMRKTTEWVVEKNLPLSDTQLANGVVQSAWVRLGKKGNGPRVRMVEFEAVEDPLIIITTLSEEDFSIEDIRILYKYRWEIEYFFRWIKCILKNRHWFCETQRGMQIQVYLALIASVLLMLFTGKRPNKRTMEMLQMYFSGWVKQSELEAFLKKVTK